MSTATKTARELATQFCLCVSREACAAPDSQCSMLTAAIEADRADREREWSETCLKWTAQLDAAEAAAKFEKHHGDLARDMNVALESANGGMLDALRNIVLRAEHGRDDKETHGPAARLIFRAIVEVCERAIATPGETPATTVSVQTPTTIARLTESDFVKMLAQLHVPAADARHWFAAYLERDAAAAAPATRVPARGPCLVCSETGEVTGKVAPPTWRPCPACRPGPRAAATTGPATCELCEGKGGYDRSCPRCDTEAAGVTRRTR